MFSMISVNGTFPDSMVAIISIACRQFSATGLGGNNIASPPPIPTARLHIRSERYWQMLAAAIRTASKCKAGASGVAFPPTPSINSATVICDIRSNSRTISLW